MSVEVSSLNLATWLILIEFIEKIVENLHCFEKYTVEMKHMFVMY